MKTIHRSDLQSTARALCRSPTFRASIQRHLPHPGDGRELQLEIHPDDQMLSHSLYHLQSAGSALSQYYGVALQQHHACEQVIDLYFPDRSRIKVLDFACGYGRLLRFLSHTVPPARIWASDIQQEAVEYVSAQFGVHGIVSSTEPSAFRPGEKFDVIWVASLFSHLPSDLFQQWLQVLAGLLTPQGVLCFSVHDEVLLPAGRSMPAEGILFAPHSENKDLERAAYGTTHVNEAYVSRVVGRAFAAGHGHYRLRRGLAYQQDLYIVARDPARNMARLDAFRWGPWGWVDMRGVTKGGDLRLSGWAASLDDGGIQAVAIDQDGARFECKTEVDRRDVESAYDDPRFRKVGWELQRPIGAQGDDSYLEVSALGANGERALLYAGPAVDPTLRWKWFGLEFVLHAVAHVAFRLRGRFG